VETALIAVLVIAIVGLACFTFWAAIRTLLLRAANPPDTPDAWTGAERVGSGLARLTRWLLALVVVFLGLVALTGSRIPGTNYKLNQCSQETKTTKQAPSTVTRTTTSERSSTVTRVGGSQPPTGSVTTTTCEPRTISDPLVLGGVLLVGILLLPAFSELSVGSLFSVKLRQGVAAAAQAAGDAKGAAEEVSRKVDNLMVSIASSSATSRAAANVSMYLGASPSQERVNAADPGDNAVNGAAASALAGISATLFGVMGDDPVVTVLRWSTTHQVLVPYRSVETTDPPYWVDVDSDFARPSWRNGIFQLAPLAAIAQLDIQMQALLRGPSAHPIVYSTPIWRDRAAGEKYGILVVSTPTEVIPGPATGNLGADDILRGAANQVGVVFERLISSGVHREH
jgi:hypothetical protein